MGQKFFISFNSADREKAHWIAWTLKDAGHQVAVHDWELSAGGNVPLWMNTKLAWADRLIAVVSPNYVPARYSPMEWGAQVWDDPDGTQGSVVPVLVRPTSSIPPLLKALSRIDLTNCSEDDAKRRLLDGVSFPEPPVRKPAFESVECVPPDPDETGPEDKPTFVKVTMDDGLPRWLKLSVAAAAIAGAIFAGLGLLFSGGSPDRECTTIAGGTVICGDQINQEVQDTN